MQKHRYPLKPRYDSASGAHLQFASRSITTSEIQHGFSSNNYQSRFVASLIEQAYWSAMQRKTFIWSTFQSFTQETQYPDYNEFMQAYQYLLPIGQTFTNAQFNKKARSNSSSQEHFSQDRFDQHYDTEEPTTSDHKKIFSTAILHQDNIAFVYICAGRLEGCGQYSLAAELWELLKQHYPKRYEYAIYRLARQTFTALRQILEKCVEDNVYAMDHWEEQVLPTISTLADNHRVSAKSNWKYQIETVFDYRGKARIIFQNFKTLLGRLDLSGAGFMEALLLESHRNVERPTFRGNCDGLDVFKKTSPGRKSDEDIIHTHRTRLLIEKFERHLPNYPFQFPGVISKLINIAEAANLPNEVLRLNKLFQLASSMSGSSFVNAVCANNINSLKQQYLQSPQAFMNLVQQFKALYTFSIPITNFLKQIEMENIYKDDKVVLDLISVILTKTNKSGNSEQHIKLVNTLQARRILPYSGANYDRTALSQLWKYARQNNLLALSYLLTTYTDSSKQQQLRPLFTAALTKEKLWHYFKYANSPEYTTSFHNNGNIYITVNHVIELLALITNAPTTPRHINSQPLLNPRQTKVLFPMAKYMAALLSEGMTQLQQLSQENPYETVEQLMQIRAQLHQLQSHPAYSKVQKFLNMSITNQTGLLPRPNFEPTSPIPMPTPYGERVRSNSGGSPSPTKRNPSEFFANTTANRSGSPHTVVVEIDGEQLEEGDRITIKVRRPGSSGTVTRPAMLIRARKDNPRTGRKNSGEEFVLSYSAPGRSNTPSQLLNFLQSFPQPDSGYSGSGHSNSYGTN